MCAHSFFGRGKCPPTLFQGGANVRPSFFQGGANVLPLVLGRAKCPGRGANVRGQMSVYFDIYPSPLPRLAPFVRSNHTETTLL